MDLTAKKTVRNTVLALAISVIALLSFAQVSHALTQAEVDFFCSIFTCTDEQRIKAEALIDEEEEDIPAPKLTRSLWRGMTGEEVKLLQEILASDPQIYPEGLVTSFFGPLTEKAVKNFQKRFGIEQVGGVGPITRATFNGIVAQSVGKSGKIPPGLLKKFGLVTTDGTDDGTGTTTDDGTGTSTNNGTPSISAVHGGKVFICHVPPGNPENAKTISVGAPAVGGHAAHGDVVGACEGEVDPEPELATPTITTTLSNPGPVVIGTSLHDSAVLAGATGDAGGTVMYKIYSDFTCSIEIVDVTPTSNTVVNGVVPDSDSHTFNSAGSFFWQATYSGDTNNEGPVSSDCISETLVVTETLVAAATEPPVISGLFAENIASTTADVVWNTDKNADSTVWYSTSTPVVANGDEVSSMTDGDLVEEHSLTLSGLTASSTYYYFAGSADADGNEATSTEEMFTTLSE